MTAEIERIRSIKSFPSLVKYLKEELEWKIEAEDIEDLTFEYDAEDLGLDKATAVKIREIKQLRPLVTNQPWGIFYISFEKKRLPIVALRRILRSLVLKKRASANRADVATWNMNDLLFISSYGEDTDRELSFAHFSENSALGDLPTLKVLGWNSGNTKLRLEDTVKTLKERLHWPDDDANTDEWRKQWASAFTRGYRETVKTSKDLAIKLADLAQVIRERVNEAISVESEKGELRKLHKAFQQALIHDLGTDDFADMYAQTIAYGLLSASVSRESGALVADNLKDMVPKTNPFLQELMGTFLTVGGRKGKIDFDELGINEVIELLRHTDMEQVKLDFGAKNPNEDPVIHFYELFLKEYDPKKRMQRGVFYTPRPVVSFIVRSVDEILRTEFGLEDGLADTSTWGEMKRQNKDLKIPDAATESTPFVQILDPATGTGTFLVEVIDSIYKTMIDKWKSQRKTEREIRELWNEYVPQHLLPRIYGFELMMAPYSIAHMKIGLKLRETGYSFLSSERAQIYLTNTLEEPNNPQAYLRTLAPALAHEAEAAIRVKKRSPITVIVGNPPYSGHSHNPSEVDVEIKAGTEYIDGWKLGSNGDPVPVLKRARRDSKKKQPTYIGRLIRDYFFCKGEPLGEQNPKWLNDDYVKFIRYSQMLNARTGLGLLSFISNNGYLANPTFRGMRFSLRSSYQRSYIVDLHGNAKKKERHPDGSKDENVFDIEQGVGVGFFVRIPNASDVKTFHIDRFGLRSEENGGVGKYDWLLQNSVTTIDWSEIYPTPKFFLFSPQDVGLSDEVEDQWSLPKIFPMNSLGIASARDSFSIDFDIDEVWRRVKKFVSLPPEEARIKFDLGKDVRDWKVAYAQEDVRSSGLKKSNLAQILYRPFDLRHTYYTGNSSGFHCMPRKDVMQHVVSHANIGLSSTRSIEIDRGWEHVFCANVMIQLHTVSIKEVNYFFLLYLYPTERDHLFGITSREANLSKEFIEAIAEVLTLEFVGDGRGDLQKNLGPEDIFHYIYAVLHSPTYRSRYAEFLKTDFPRIPLTGDVELFRRLCQLGCDLVALHLLEPDYDATSWKHERKMFPTEKHRFKFKGNDDVVAAGHPKYDADNERVYINKTSYFAGVPEAIWNFHIGGYQVCHKWLKDRKGRSLSTDDQLHYNKIVIALGETIRLMGEIDEVIEAHGGWPLAGSQNKP